MSPDREGGRGSRMWSIRCVATAHWHDDSDLGQTTLIKKSAELFIIYCSASCVSCERDNLRSFLSLHYAASSNTFGWIYKLSTEALDPWLRNAWKPKTQMHSYTSEVFVNVTKHFTLKNHININQWGSKRRLETSQVGPAAPITTLIYIFYAAIFT